MQKKIFFHHIMKTAGLSVRDYFEEHVANGIKYFKIIPNLSIKYYPISCSDYDAILALDQLILGKSNTNAFFSHIPFALLDKYTADIDMFTFLRDPTSRQLSHIRYLRSWLATACDKTLGLLTSKLHSSETYNFQVLNLTSLDPWDPSIDIKDHLISAKYNLEHKFMFFGFTENLQDCLDLLAKKLDCYFGLKVGHTNTSTDKNIDMSDIDIDLLKEKNWADYELYAFAKDLFRKRYPSVSI